MELKEGNALNFSYAFFKAKNSNKTTSTKCLGFHSAKPNCKRSICSSQRKLGIP